MATVKAGSSEPAFVAPEVADGAQIWLLRHGETEWSASGQHTSRTDIGLTDTGRRQATAAGELVAHVAPALVLSSPRRRALETAELAGLRVDETTEDLAEWDYGAYEGRTTAQIRQDVPDWSVWTHGAPGGETAEQIRVRADRTLSRAARACLEGPVVLIGHGHFSRALGARWIGMPVSGGGSLLLSTAAAAILSAQYGQTVIDRWNLPNPTADN